MAEKLVYLREAEGLPDIPAQQALIRRAGVPGVNPDVDHAYCDRKPKKRATETASGFPERDRCTRAIRRGEGDTVVIAAPGVAGVSIEDALRALEGWAARGASVFVVSENLTVPPGDGPALVRLAQRIAGDAAMNRTAKARAASRKRAKLTRAQQKAAWARAAEMWPDVAAYTVDAISKETGISASTLYRAARQKLLPERKAQPFGASLMLPKPKPARKRRS